MADSVFGSTVAISDFTSARFAFAFLKVNERNRDVSTVAWDSIVFCYEEVDNQPMTTRVVLSVGAIVGLLVSSAVLALMWFGVSGVLYVGHTDLMRIFWPSSVILTIGWRTTLHGIGMTAVSVALNCLLYMAVAYALRRVALTVGS